jgi:hypothetical protein
MIMMFDVYLVKNCRIRKSTNLQYKLISLDTRHLAKLELHIKMTLFRDVTSVSEIKKYQHFCRIFFPIVSVKEFRPEDGDGDLPCRLVVRVLGYRSGGQGSIPGTARKKK